MRPLFPFNVISCSSLVVLLVSLVTVTSFNWNDDRNGEIKWSPDCDFYGSNIVRSTTTDAGCRDACWESSECTHFSWSSGTCYLKRFNFPAIVEDIVGRICGWINTNKRPKTSGDKPVIHDAKRNIGSIPPFCFLKCNFTISLTFQRDYLSLLGLLQTFLRLERQRTC